MAKVKCNLPNASGLISGVKFVSHAAGGMVSEELTDERAAEFCEIPGYELFDPKAKAAAKQTPADPNAPPAQ